MTHTKDMNFKGSAERKKPVPNGHIGHDFIIWYSQKDKTIVTVDSSVDASGYRGRKVYLQSKSIGCFLGDGNVL